MSTPICKNIDTWIYYTQVQIKNLGYKDKFAGWTSSTVLPIIFKELPSPRRLLKASGYNDLIELPKGNSFL